MTPPITLPPVAVRRHAHARCTSYRNQQGAGLPLARKQQDERLDRAAARRSVPIVRPPASARRTRNSAHRRILHPSCRQRLITQRYRAHEASAMADAPRAPNIRGRASKA